MTHEPTDIPAALLPLRAFGGAGLERLLAPVEDPVSSAYFLFGRQRGRGMHQQVKVVGHDLISDHPHSIQQADPSQEPDKLLLLDITKGPVLGRADSAIKAMIPRVGLVDFDARSSHTNQKERAGLIWTNFFGDRHRVCVKHWQQDGYAIN